jgi:hypothetical protein
VRPAVGIDHLGRLVGLIPVPLHHRVGANGDLTLLAERSLDSVIVDDAQLEEWMGATGRPQMPRRRTIGQQLVVALMQRGQGHDHF